MINHMLATSSGWR